MSIIRSLVLYTQQQVSVVLVMLTASAIRILIALVDSQHNLYDIYQCRVYIPVPSVQ